MLFDQSHEFNVVGARGRHQLGREGYGYQMKRDYKSTPEELSGKNLPFTSNTDKEE